jgi:tRNA(adenine34) deaminase
MYFEARAIDTLDFVAKAYRNDLDITSGVLKEDCADLYYRPWDRVPIDEQGNI